MIGFKYNYGSLAILTYLLLVMKPFSLANLIITILILSILWVSMSGFFDLLHLFYGAVSIALVVLVNYQLKRKNFFDDELTHWSSLRYFRGFYYIFWLLGQILKSGFQIALIILKSGMPIQPYVVQFKTDLPNTQAKVILGNSITLTPGTLTVDIEGDLFTVHALTPQSYESIVKDQMPRQVLALFSSSSRPVVHELNIMDRNSINNQAG